MNKILIFLISICFYLSQTYAWVVPGTIQKGTNSTSVSCSTSTSSYVTSNGCNAAGQCKPYSCNPYSCSPYSCNCKTTWSWTGAVTTCGTCYNTCYKTCYQSWWETYWESKTSYNNYISNPSTTITYAGSIKLTNDTQTCNPRTTWVASSADYGWYKSCSAWSCGSWGAGSWYKPYHGYCSSATSVKTIISSYDQLWNRTYSFNNSETTQYNSTRDVNLTATCQIEWRYANSDTLPPTPTISWAWVNVFQNDENQWCNIKKYRSEWYTYKADENPWCEFYKAKNGTIIWQEDLLKWLEINIPSDPSGIWEVQVKIWSCPKYTYIPNSNDLSIILVSTSSPSWVKPTYTNAFTIKYNQSVTALGKTQPSLLNAMGVDRLDKCLSEWKNSILVLTKDMARSTADGITLTPNASQKVIKWTINIDNSTSKLELSWDLSNTSFTWTPLTVKEWFYWTVENKDIWRNFTLNWNIKWWEEFEWGIFNECKSFSGTLTWQCSGSLVWGQIWTSPSGVNPTSWKFMQYKCDGLWPFPTTAECKMWCPVWKIWNPNTKKCEGNACKAYVGWSEVVIENWVNGVVTGDTCMAYCIPWHSLNCVVKEIKVACSGTFEVERGWELNCWDNSTANQWYKEKWRCWETEWINYRNGIISEHGTQWAKEFFNENFLQNCQWSAGTTDIKKCNDILICWYWEYNIATKKCIRNECWTGLVNGICWSGNGTTLERFPSLEQACSSGMPITVDFNAKDGNYNWICDGKDGWTRAYCSANVQSSYMCILDATLDCTLY